MADPAAPAKGLMKTIKKVPTPVLLAGGGIAIGLAYTALRNRSEPVPDETGSETGYADTTVGVDYGPGYATPVGIVPTQPNYTDSGETVGAVSQTAIDALIAQQTSITEMFTNFITEFMNREQPTPTIPDNTPPPVTVPPPPQKAAPPPAPAPTPTKPPHYHSGSTVRNGAGTVSKNFPGASGWIEIPTSDRTFADFHVAFPNGVLQRWRLFGRGNHVPKAKRGDQVMIWQGKWR